MKLTTITILSSDVDADSAQRWSPAIKLEEEDEDAEG